jgi:membrane-associated protease RseP (regulator of RpoE activity)
MLPNLHLDVSVFGPGSLAALSQPILVALVGSWMALLFHELGHAAAAVLVGVRIWGIRLGIGPTIWRGRIGSCRVHVALFPLLGAVHLLDEDACAIGYRDIVAGRWRFEWGPRAWRAPVISVAGGLSNLLGVLLLAMCWEALGHPTLASTAGEVLLFGMAANIGGYLNLLPCFRSDGIHLLAHIRAARFSLQPAASVG